MSNDSHFILFLYFYWILARNYYYYYYFHHFYLNAFFAEKLGVVLEIILYNI
jgi:hypothetical protein